MGHTYEVMINRVIEYRKASQISQEDFAEILGITQGHYCKIEHGQKIMSGKMLQRLQWFSSDIDYFFTGQKKLVTELDPFLKDWTGRSRYDYLALVVWLVNRGSVMEGLEAKASAGGKQLAYLRYLMEADFAPRSVWYCIRKANALTQSKMAENLGINVKKYREMEKGDRILDIDAEILSNLYETLDFCPSLTMGSDEALLAGVNRIWVLFQDDTREKLIEILKTASAILL